MTDGEAERVATGDDVGRITIPGGVYYNDDPNGLGPNFYDMQTRRGMGWDFWNQWRMRRDEFPRAPEIAAVRHHLDAMGRGETG